MTASLNIRNLPIHLRSTVLVPITRPLADELFTARAYGVDAIRAREIMEPGETPDMLFLRLLYFYQHANRYDSDTALAAAMARAEATR